MILPVPPAPKIPRAARTQRLITNLMGFSEILLILFAVLILFGADKLPEVARSLGKTIRQVRDATDEIKTEIQHTVQHGSSAGNSLLEETQKEIEQIKEDIEEIKEEVAGNHLPKD